MTAAPGQAMSIPGTLVAIRGLGVLLTGESSVGKSELALDLVSRGHRLIADDGPLFTVRDGELHGGCPEGLGGFLEVRGLGILNVRSLYGEGAVSAEERLALVVRLARVSDEQFPRVDRLQPSYRELVYLGVAVPEVALPVVPGRNLAVLVEVAVKNHALRREGYDAARDFMERQLRLIESVSGGS